MLSFKKTLFFLSFNLLFIFSINSYSQCGISGLELSNVNCIENATYQYDLNFVVAQSTLDSFNLYINDDFKGRYSPLQLPLHVISDKYYDTDEDIVKVEDADNEECFEETSISNPCGCAQFDFEYTKINCTDSTFNIMIDFNYLHTGDSFDIGMIRSPFGTHAYKDLPFEIGPFYSADTTYLLFLADKSDFFCFLETPLDGKSCPPCNMSDLDMISYECDNDFKKNITFTFNYTNPGSDKYNIFVNNDFYASFDFKYSTIIDSITMRDTFEIGPVAIDCDSTLIIRIEDSENPDCAITEDYNSLCCEFCELGELQFRDIECISDSSFNFILDFSYSNNTLDSFELTSSSGMLNKYSVNDLPLHFTDYPVTDAGFDTLSVSMDKGRCSSSGIIEFPFCDYYGCNLENISYEVTFDTIESYWITLNFTSNNTSDSFSIQGNGIHYGNFNFNELPVTLGPYNCKDSLQLEYIIKDLEVEDCYIVLEPDMVTCPPNYVHDFEILEDWIIRYSVDSRIVNIYSTNSIFNDAKVDIFDIKGLKLNSYKLPNGLHSAKLRLDDLNTGIYLLRLSNDGKIKTRKIFVK